MILSKEHIAHVKSVDYRKYTSEDWDDLFETIESQQQEIKQLKESIEELRYEKECQQNIKNKYAEEIDQKDAALEQAREALGHSLSLFALGVNAINEKHPENDKRDKARAIEGEILKTLYVIDKSLGGNGEK